MLLCALPAPFLPKLFDDQSRSVQVIVSGNVGFDQRVMDQILAGIREAVNDRDVIVFERKRAP